MRQNSQLLHIMKDGYHPVWKPVSGFLQGQVLFVYSRYGFFARRCVSVEYLGLSDVRGLSRVSDAFHTQGSMHDLCHN